MTFLELCQRTVEKCAISGSIVSVTGQTGEMLRVVHWVDEAWRDIQSSQSNWDWMREEFTFQTIPGQQEYSVAATAVANFGKWHTDTFRLYSTAIGVSDEQFLPEWLYLTFRNTYMFGVPKQDRPTVFAVRPRGSSLLFGDTPNDIYTVSGEYQRRPIGLTANTDTPDMPEEYHLAIVHAARMKYAAYESAAEVMAEASRDYERVMSNMSVTQLDDIGTGQPLA